MTHPHRSHPTLTLVPVGGLANRMRAIVSAAALTGETGHTLHVVWFKDAGLNCRFDELFCPIGRTDIRLHEATFADFLLHDRPRRKNLWLPGLFQHAAFDARLYEQAPELAPGSPFDAGQWLAGHSRAYIATCYPFHPSPTSLYAALFRPVEAIERQVRTYTERFSAHTVGIHIRRTDNAMSIALSHRTQEERHRINVNVIGDNQRLYEAIRDRDSRRAREEIYRQSRVFLSSNAIPGPQKADGAAERGA